MASAEGPRSAVDRHVGLTLALYMSAEGLGAWPSQDTLALRTGLTDRTIGRCLERLVAGKWLDRSARRSARGTQHKRFGYEYRARLPRHLADAYMKGERRSLFTGKDLGPTTKVKPSMNGESHDMAMANGVRTNTAYERIKSLPIGKDRRKGSRCEGAPTAAAQQVLQHRAALERWVADYEAPARRAA